MPCSGEVRSWNRYLHSEWWAPWWRCTQVLPDARVRDEWEASQSRIFPFSVKEKKHFANSSVIMVIFSLCSLSALPNTAEQVEWVEKIFRFSYWLFCFLFLSLNNKLKKSKQMQHVNYIALVNELNFLVLKYFKNWLFSTGLRFEQLNSVMYGFYYCETIQEIKS